MNRLSLILPFSVLASVTITGVLSAGPLTPPAGPITSTGKTLTEIEPRIAINAANTPGDADSVFRIAQPGSYYLTGNVQGVANMHGIEIAVSNVSIDLRGFELIGVPDSLDGIRATLNNSNSVRIANGTISGWQNGINLMSAFIRSTVVESVTAHGNGTNGIAVYGGVVRACAASGNGFAGIRSSLSASVTDCTATQNTGHGFVLENYCFISGCTATQNTLDGIRVSSGCHVLDNNCAQNGLTAGDGAGIHAILSDNRIEGNNCTSADRGVDVDSAGNIIVRNSCAGNTTDWDIAANNIYGPIIDRRTPASDSVNGFFAAGTLGSTDPNANFSY